MVLPNADTPNESPLLRAFYQRFLMKKKFLQILSLAVICGLSITMLYPNTYALRKEQQTEERVCVNASEDPLHFCFDVAPLLRDVRAFPHFVEGVFKYEFSFGSHQIPLQIEFERVVKITIGCLPLMRNTTETLHVIFGLDRLTVNGKPVEATVPESYAFRCAHNVPNHLCSMWLGSLYFRKGFDLEYMPEYMQKNSTPCRVRPMMTVVRERGAIMCNFPFLNLLFGGCGPENSSERKNGSRL